MSCFNPPSRLLLRANHAMANKDDRVTKQAATDDRVSQLVSTLRDHADDVAGSPASAASPPHSARDSPLISFADPHSSPHLTGLGKRAETQATPVLVTPDRKVFDWMSDDDEVAEAPTQQRAPQLERRVDTPPFRGAPTFPTEISAGITCSFKHPARAGLLDLSRDTHPHTDHTHRTKQDNANAKDLVKALATAFPDMFSRDRSHSDDTAALETNPRAIRSGHGGSTRLVDKSADREVADVLAPTVELLRHAEVLLSAVQLHMTGNTPLVRTQRDVMILITAARNAVARAWIVADVRYDVLTAEHDKKRGAALLEHRAQIINRAANDQLDARRRAELAWANERLAADAALGSVRAAAFRTGKAAADTNNNNDKNTKLEAPAKAGAKRQ